MSTSNAFAGPWSSLPVTLTPWIMDVLNSMGHTQMTPVQASTIPLFMRHRDVVVEAVTGSGKTLAFVIPILEKLVRREEKLRKNEIGALIISPTMELATQIHSVFSLFLSSHSRSSSDVQDPAALATSEPLYPPPLLIVSSESTAQNVQNFLNTGADIVIGTPGRIEEFILGKGKNVVSTRELEVLVLDEADRLLDLGFSNTLTHILAHLPKQRRTGLFSATMTDADAMSELVRVGLRNPARIVVKVQAKKTGSESQSNKNVGVIEERRIPANLQNLFLACGSSEKLLELARIITHEVENQQSSRFIVYFATCACVEYFYRILSLFLPTQYALYSLHGHLPPASRTRTLASFASSVATPSSPCILLATDVAARGLDLPNVDIVVQFDPPSDPRTFSHRCGRTARAGRHGRAWVLLVGRERDLVEFMAVRKIPLKEHPPLTTSESSRLRDEGTIADDVTRALSKIRTKVLHDRALHDLAIKAYVSFVRAYSKHEASYIFRIKDLDLVGVAQSFGLLRLPRMPELNGVSRDSWEDAEVDWDVYAYLDRAREVKRLSEIQKKTEAAADSRAQYRERAEIRKANAPWSIKTTKKEEKEKRRDKKERKRKWIKDQTIERTSTDPKRNRNTLEADKTLDDNEDVEDDWGELAREERLAKKVKKGHLSQDAFDDEFALL